MLKCKDFQVEDQTEFFNVSRKFEPIESVLERVNAWINTKNIKVLNVETFFHSPCTVLPTTKREHFIRLWYEE